MARRKKFEVERENHDRWLVSYADFITLLFAFFVVMYAISVINQNKYQQLASSLGSAFGSAKDGTALDGRVPVAAETAAPEAHGLLRGSSFIKPFAAVRARDAQWRREREAMTALALEASQVLAPLIERGQIRILQSNRGIRIDIESQVLFMQGSAELEATARTPLLQIAELLAGRSNAVQIEGHTDSVPIHNNQFHSNWELSATRASTVVRLLEEHGIEARRLSAVGYGSAQPVGDNETAAGRASNRRVAIMVLYAPPPGTDEGAEISAKP